MLKNINIANYRLPKGNPASHMAFVVISVLTAIIFMLFWFVGYDTPYAEDANFVAPLFTDLLLVFVCLVFVVAVASTAWSVVRTLKSRGKGERMVNNIPAKNISYGVVIVTVVVLLAALVLGSSDAIMVNGTEYSDKFWLHVADMFVYSSLVLVIIAVGTIVVFTAVNNRKR